MDNNEHLSKYQQKRIKAMTKTMNGKIAFKICELEQDHKISIMYGKEWEDFEYHIEGTDVTLNGSPDSMVWKIWRPVKYKANRSYLKIVPKFGLSYDEIVDILQTEKWLYL